ncbi:MAG: hypothetical protein ACHQDD_01500 [Steroidobacterales bacterium]
MSVPLAVAVTVPAPNLAAWTKNQIDGALGAAGTSASAVGLDKLADQRVLYHGLSMLGSGATLGGLMHSEAIGIGQSPLVTVAYVCIAALMAGCTRLFGAPQRATAPLP